MSLKPLFRLKSSPNDLLVTTPTKNNAIHLFLLKGLNQENWVKKIPPGKSLQYLNWKNQPGGIIILQAGTAQIVFSCKNLSTRNTYSLHGNWNSCQEHGFYANPLIYNNNKYLLIFLFAKKLCI